MSNFFGNKSFSSSKEVYETSESIVQKMGNAQLQLGRYTSFGIINDPRQVGFRIARQKFVAKMFADFDRVLEIGCQEGFTSLFVAPYVKKLIAVDYYKPHIDEAIKLIKPHLPNVDFFGRDILDGPIFDNEDLFNGIFCLDVLEHISPEQELIFMKNVVDSLDTDGVLILGMPSLESQAYASEGSKLGHINCKSAPALNKLCSQYFKNVFMFGMNDEILHTGFHPMCQYLFAMCVGTRK